MTGGRKEVLSAGSWRNDAKCRCTSLNGFKNGKTNKTVLKQAKKGTKGSKKGKCRAPNGQFEWGVRKVSRADGGEKAE